MQSYKIFVFDDRGFIFCPRSNALTKETLSVLHEDVHTEYQNQQNNCLFF